MAELDIVKVFVVAVLLAASVSSQLLPLYKTEGSWENITLPSSPPAITIIRFSRAPDTHNPSAKFKIQNSKGYQYASEEFTFSKSDERKNIITLLYAKVWATTSRVVTNMLTGEGKTWTTNEPIIISVWSNQLVAWEVINIDDTIYDIPIPASSTAAMSTTTAMSTTMPSAQPLDYLNPAFLALAGLCALFALISLVLSVLHCQKCASTSNGLQEPAPSSDDTTFKTTENVQRQVQYPYNYDGPGALHISVNSL